MLSAMRLVIDVTLYFVIEYIYKNENKNTGNTKKGPKARKDKKRWYNMI